MKVWINDVHDDYELRKCAEDNEENSIEISDEEFQDYLKIMIKYKQWQDKISKLAEETIYKH